MDDTLIPHVSHLSDNRLDKGIRSQHLFNCWCRDIFNAVVLLRVRRPLCPNLVVLAGTIATARDAILALKTARRCNSNGPSCQPCHHGRPCRAIVCAATNIGNTEPIDKSLIRLNETCFGRLFCSPVICYFSLCRIVNGNMAPNSPPT